MIINAQPPPLLTNYCCGCCAHRFEYIFWYWPVIAVRSKAYCPNPGNISSILMSIKKIRYLLTVVRRIIRFALSSCLLQHHTPRFRVEEVDKATLSNNRNPSPHTMKGVIGKVTVDENDTLIFLPIYHLQIMAQSNGIAEAFSGACVSVPLSYSLP